MRRVVGCLLVVLGAFFIVMAVLMRTYISGQVLKFPLNEYRIQTLRAAGISYFSPGKLRVMSGVTLDITGTIKGDVAAGTPSTAVWDQFSYLYDVTDRVPYEYQTRRMAFDRRTGQLVNCCGANLNGNKAIRQYGLSGYIWPFGTQKKTYDVFDTTLDKAMPARYEGTMMIDGTRAFRFVEHVVAMRAASQTLPGFLVGMKGRSSVTLGEYYTATNTYWVDPVTGALVDLDEDQKLALGPTAGVQRLLLFNGDIAFSPQTVRAIGRLDASGRRGVDLLRSTLPLAGGLVGFPALLAGAVLVWTRRDRHRGGRAAAHRTQ
jgi:Porin PorA